MLWHNYHKDTTKRLRLFVFTIGSDKTPMQTILISLKTSFINISKQNKTPAFSSFCSIFILPFRVFCTSFLVSFTIYFSAVGSPLYKTNFYKSNLENNKFQEELWIPMYLYCLPELYLRNFLMLFIFSAVIIGYIDHTGDWQKGWKIAILFKIKIKN